MSRRPASAAAVTKDKFFMMDTVSDDAQKPSADSDSTLLDVKLQIQCRISHRLLQKLLDQLKQVCCDLEMKIHLVLTDLHYNVDA